MLELGKERQGSRSWQKRDLRASLAIWDPVKKKSVGGQTRRERGKRIEAQVWYMHLSSRSASFLSDNEPSAHSGKGKVCCFFIWEYDIWGCR